MQSVDRERDLGVTVSDSLKVDTQCMEAYGKASGVLGMMKRTITTRCREVLMPLYKTLVRPHLEYCSSTWSPHYQKGKDLIERVQHRFTRLFSSMRKVSYDDRLTQVGLWTLEDRRNREDLREVFKIVKGLSSVPMEQFFTLSQNVKTRGHIII